ncbi:TIGR04219 family outer membrane beta-barrel protein [Persephonella sp. IF05-L8]|uniref:TIGR04219 family outer membrane beta-barrel protein n=1 Tax=Persephonella sp. IF05-L8 TaxID=1158338 RepID=UPI00068F1257
MKKLFFIALSSIFTVSSAIAVPGVDGEISAGYIKQSIDGSGRYKGNDISVDELGLSDENSFFLKAKIEHPIPILPNIKLMYERMRFEGVGTVKNNYTFGNITITVNDRVYSKLRLDHYDAVLFYNLPFINLTQILDAEFGLNIRVIDFYAKVKDLTTGDEDSTSLTIPIPMIHGAIEFKPVGYFSILVEGNGIAYGGHHFYDITGELRIKPVQTLMAKPFIGIGYKYEKLKIDDIDDVSANIKIKQPFVEAGILF